MQCTGLCLKLFLVTNATHTSVLPSCCTAAVAYTTTSVSCCDLASQHLLAKWRIMQISTSSCMHGVKPTCTTLIFHVWYRGMYFVCAQFGNSHSQKRDWFWGIPGRFWNWTSWFHMSSYSLSSLVSSINFLGYFFLNYDWIKNCLQNPERFLHCHNSTIKNKTGIFSVETRFSKQ